MLVPGRPCWRRTPRSHQRTCGLAAAAPLQDAAACLTAHRCVLRSEHCTRSLSGGDVHVLQASSKRATTFSMMLVPQEYLYDPLAYTHEAVVVHVMLNSRRLLLAGGVACWHVLVVWCHAAPRRRCSCGALPRRAKAEPAPVGHQCGHFHTICRRPRQRRRRQLSCHLAAACRRCCSKHPAAGAQCIASEAGGVFVSLACSSC